ncbi:hypothetical protein SDC9_191733 [bioreactor metagenome]|uniref:Uncharacterized protein n=1 Tax=bioreactor metagenome TaxID=1076179 RepID=A0A645I0A2_9ZZZZ
MGFAGGHVAEGGAGILGVEIDSAQKVARLLVQTRRIDHRSRRHYPDDVPVHQPLCRGGVFHLLADGHFIALGDEPGDIGVAGVVGNAAHRHPVLRGLVGVLVPAGQGQVQFP